MSLSTMLSDSIADIEGFSTRSKLKNRHDVRIFQAWILGFQENMRAKSLWIHFNPQDKKEMEKEQLREDVCGDDKQKIAANRLRLIEGQDKAVAILKQSISKELPTHIQDQETPEAMLKALTPTTHVLDSLQTLVTICSLNMSDYTNAVDMMEELQRLFKDLQACVTKDDQRLKLSESFIVMLATAKLGNEHSQLRTDAVLHGDKAPKFMLELIELVRVFDLARSKEEGGSKTQVAHLQCVECETQVAHYHKQHQEASKQRCNRCKYGKHRTEDCREPICRYCNIPGHREEECKKKMAAEARGKEAPPYQHKKKDWKNKKRDQSRDKSKRTPENNTYMCFSAFLGEDLDEADDINSDVEDGFADSEVEEGEEESNIKTDHSFATAQEKAAMKILTAKFEAKDQESTSSPAMEEKDTLYLTTSVVTAEDEESSNDDDVPGLASSEEEPISDSEDDYVYASSFVRPSFYANPKDKDDEEKHQSTTHQQLNSANQKADDSFIAHRNYVNLRKLSLLPPRVCDLGVNYHQSTGINECLNLGKMELRSQHEQPEAPSVASPPLPETITQHVFMAGSDSDDHEGSSSENDEEPLLEL